MATSADGFIFSVIGGLVTGTAGFFFLQLKEKFTNKKEIVYGVLDEIEILTKECVDKASMIWLKDKPEPLETNEVVIILHDISQLISFINSREDNTKIRTNSALLNFRRAISGDDFDVKSRKASPQRISRIRSSATSLRIVLKEIKLERRPLKVI